MEANSTDSVNLNEICKLLSDWKSYVEIELELAFISEYGKQMIGLIGLLENKRKPTAHQIYNAIQEFQNSLECGKSSVSYSARLESIIDKNQLSDTSLALLLIKFQDGFKIAYEKLVKHITIQRRALDFFKATRVFDPRQKSALPRSLLEYSIIPGLKNPSAYIIEE